MNFQIQVGKFLFVLLLLSIFGFFSTIFAQKNKKPKSIRLIDFNNRNYQVPGETIRLKKGRYNRGDVSYKLESKKYKDFDGDKSDEVVITIQKSTKGLVGRYKVYLVYTYKNNGLKFIFGQIRPRGEAVQIGNNQLILTGFLWEKGDADCCPSKKEIETYKWNKKKRGFVLAKRRSKRV